MSGSGRVAIVGGCRTPFGRAGSVYRNLTALDLAKACTRELLERTEVDPEWIDKVGRLMHDGMEADLLQFAEGTTEYSRLACQIPMKPMLDGLVLHLPEQQY